MPLRASRVPARGEGRRTSRSPAARRCRAPSSARRTRSTSAPPAFRCSRDASSRRPIATGRAGRDPQPDARRPGSFPTGIRSDSGSRGRATCCDSSASAATGAPSSASWATRRTAGSTPSRTGRCLSAVRRRRRCSAAGLVIRAERSATGAGAGRDAHRPQHRADGPDRERADGRRRSRIRASRRGGSTPRSSRRSACWR